MSGDEIYVADLQSKRVALAIAGKLGLRERTLTINLLPMTLVKVADAVSFLLTEIQRNDLIPEQIIVEFTEREVISRMDEFTDAVRKLKGAGIRVAIDHFGAGFAGLSLLAQYQPDRIKIDQQLIRNIHRDGPRQAIVQAIIKCCHSLEIAVSVVGVEQAEEWMWLEAAGISHFGEICLPARDWVVCRLSPGRGKYDPSGDSVNILSSFFPHAVSCNLISLSVQEKRVVQYA